MKIAHIVPPTWTGVYPQGDYRMVLAQWVKTENEHFIKRVQKGNAYLLLDSGTFEDEQVTPEQQQRAATRVNADEVILPDIRGDAKGTLRRSWEALRHITCERVMFVPQGATMIEWYDCLAAWMTQWESSGYETHRKLCIGIATIYGTDLGKSEQIEDAATFGYPMHMLGLPSLERLGTDLLTAHVHGVRGIDTSTAFAQAAAHLMITPTNPKIHLGDIYQYETLRGSARRLVHLNMNILNHWIVDGADVSDKIPTRLIRDTAMRWAKYWAEGFVELGPTMATCGVPKGRYAMLKKFGREVYVRPIKDLEDLREGEKAIEL